ncbi:MULTISPECIES: nicotinate-nucleotide--dimethylbenzimidazole phosphoribosyltransferase [Streptomyces]|uniref:Nicotinate-nucleotide--dimethylbenzimidazole phosphoribosyltransferase n=1 Tax=Streptomyces koelreuteriae TaxID=2838015 RepID=A0ABX8G070_9ACTN|nr:MULTISPECIES: nicotinate-nucleotide--dimethylbenzimidazole phosphoribosyltransferase [Streptomyces]QWB26761.1 nicotinate-nucleotide--dimethylbenzimidazole phosphoribosyltransferase [Streptomyces koelreuteriae]UUA09842.1 nicotinate-nucleotide--dimethylbenzimidazole phosphoribosyltransferase [Streptomyces koelreuteriae]UUA17447.1 nicotinate-nucleotide--dimethylbenzimidazole phosphoribosyltransferase [Streptomyces sp. CRCS-T-1]
MTDTGQVPGEGLPENAGMVEQPGVPAHGSYTYLSEPETTAEDDDLLLLPGAQGAWGNEVAPPMPEPVAETVHEPGPHEISGRDSGSVDLGGVRLPDPPPIPPVTPRRPLHLGPPLPDSSASPVRSLADRGPADAPLRQPVAAAGPEYLDAPRAPEMPSPPAAPWDAQVTHQAQVAVGVAPAETVVPETQPVAEVEEPVQVAEAVSAPEPVPAEVPVPAAASPEAPEPVAVGDSAGSDSADAGDQVPAAVEEQDVVPAPVAESLPVAEAAPAPEAVPFPEAATAPEAPAEMPEATPAVAPEAVAPEPVAPEAVAEAPAEVVGPEAIAPVPDASAPEAVVPEPDPSAPEAVAPEPDAPGVEAPAPVAEPLAPQAAPAPAPEATAPQPAPEAPAPVAPAPAAADAPEAPVAPEAPAAPVQPAPMPAQVTETPVPDAPAEAPAPPQAPEVTEPAPVAEEVAPEPAPVAQEIAPEPTAAAEEVAPDLAPAAEEATPDPAPEPVTPAPETMDVPPAPAEDVTVVLPEPIAEEKADEQTDEQSMQPVQGPQQSQPPAAPRPVQPEEPESPAPAATVPAPRDGDAELVQNADDLDTRAAEQEDLADQVRHDEESTAAVAEAPQPTGPAAPGFDPAEREAVLKVMRERRDIRNGFRSDPIPHEVLLRVLEAAHHAPSVGHSQPWDFVVIRSADTRRAMHELAMRQREAYAKSLPKGRAKQFKELKIEAILDTPVNIVVTADPTRGGRHTLGRHTQPQMAPYSAALAVENLWLAARAEGLGVGWVSFFDEREMVRALGLPEHLEVIAYLCVGYVDEFPDEPELLQAGWSKRRPLSWVVHEETYGRRALPGEEPHDLLAETVAQIRPLDAKALGEAWERQKRMTKPAGALGMLEIISAQLSGLSRQCPPPIPEPAAVAIFAGDHGVHAQGVTPWPQEVTAQMVANFLGGGAVCNAFATQVGAEVCIVDVGVAADLPATPGLLPRKVRAGTSDLTTGPAMTREEAKQAIEVGIETARDLVAAGNKALLTGEMGIANTTASAALISVFTGADPAEVTGRGTGINDETLARKTEVVRRALELHQPDPADPIGVLAAIGGFEHAAIVGLLLGGASLRTPVILDGVSAGAAALVARAIAPEVLAACIAGHRSAEPGHVAALNKLGLRPLVDLDLRLGEGTGALLALPLVQSTARAMHEVATFDSAGVTEK